LNRKENLSLALDESQFWDVIIIGGGATGLGCAVDAASRGYQTLLLEGEDFAKGTSSRSTKLVHGGVRYLQQGNIKLVLEALKERGLLLKNAPHLVRNQSFIVPNYKWWEGPFYGIGLKVYDMLARQHSFGGSEWLSKEEVTEHIPTIEQEGLRGGVKYHDGQFDDARLAINLAQTAVDNGACLVNYCKVVKLLKSRNLVNGVIALDTINNTEFKLKGKVVINATGVFTDQVLQMDEADGKQLIAPSQGVHIVVDKEFLPGSSAIMVPHTDDGRVLFAVPWHNKVVLGTTDTPIEKASIEPKALPEEVEFIMKHAARYLTKDPTPADVRSVFAGLRPLVRQVDAKNTATLSRDHLLWVSPSGLITITGGKWTTYRKMAEDTINLAIDIGSLKEVDCCTKELMIHGASSEVNENDAMAFYGSDAEAVQLLQKNNMLLMEKLHPLLPYTKANVVWAVQQEMAETVEDVLSRRTRSLLLNAKASVEAAPVVAQKMASLMHKDENWEKEQVANYTALAKSYQLD
jgi:glycerol-3-phosphate dehydrogenase